MADASTNTKILSFIVKKFPAARKRSIDENSKLLESGIVDSMGVLDVVGFLEQSFNIKIVDDELTPENFASVSCMASFVEGKRNHTQDSAK
jgi:acyl carrier protein